MRLLSIILCCFFFTGYTYAQNEFSEAIGLQKDLLQKNPQDTKALKEISFLYLHQANYDEAIRYGEQLLYIGYQSGDYDYALLYAHIVLGQANMMKGNKKEATANLSTCFFRELRRRSAQDTANYIPFCSSTYPAFII